MPESPTSGIPTTYVPGAQHPDASLALGWAEVIGAVDIFVGVNAVDYSGYPGLPPAIHRCVRAACAARDQSRQSRERASKSMRP